MDKGGRELSDKQINQVLSEISQIQQQMGVMTTEALKKAALALEKKEIRPWTDRSEPSPVSPLGSWSGVAQVVPEMSEKIKDLKLDFEDDPEPWYDRTLAQLEENQLRKAASEPGASSVISMSVQGEMVLDLNYGTHGETLRVFFGKNHIQIQWGSGTELKIPRT